MPSIKFEPAVLVYIANTLVNLLTAFGLGLSADQVASVSVIAAAAATVVTAVTTRPVPVPMITGAAATVLTAAAAFGLDWSPEQIGAVVAAGSIAMAFLLRQNVSPAPALAASPPPRRA